MAAITVTLYPPDDLGPEPEQLHSPVILQIPRTRRASFHADGLEEAAAGTRELSSPVDT